MLCLAKSRPAFHKPSKSSVDGRPTQGAGAGESRRRSRSRSRMPGMSMMGMMRMMRMRVGRSQKLRGKMLLMKISSPYH